MFRGKGSTDGTFLLVSFTQLYPLVNTTSTMPQALQGLGGGRGVSEMDGGGERREGCSREMDPGQKDSQLIRQNRLEESTTVLIKMSL